MAARVESINVDQGAATTATLVASKTGYKVQVIGLCLAIENGALGVKSTLQDVTANTVRMTMVSMSATTVLVYTRDGTAESPAFETAIGEGLELVTGTAALCHGQITYRYVLP